MKYECKGICGVVNKLKELNMSINSKEDEKYIKDICRYIRNIKGSQNDSFDYINTNGEDVSIYIEYDKEIRYFYVEVNKD